MQIERRGLAHSDTALGNEAKQWANCFDARKFWDGDVQHILAKLSEGDKNSEFKVKYKYKH